MPAFGSIHSIYRYPVKSMAGEAIEQAWVNLDGLEGDRLCAFESSGAPAGMLRLTGSERREMLRCQPMLRPNGDVEVLVPGGDRLRVDSHAMLDYLQTRSEKANEFVLTQASSPQTDVRPLSLVSIQTVGALSAELGQEIDPRRFRANLYLDLPEGPFTEYRFVGKALRIGAAATILIRERAPRCRFVTYDPEDPLGTAPLFELMKLLDRHHQARCGVYATIQKPGPIFASDSLSLAEETAEECLTTLQSHQRS
ncbi:MAG TPA: MOSC domain-containing protein [Acidobacteriaceae bacterium]|nr:MOSC domain-containing protein [Acidobacteriaceae bacterium]